LNALIAALARIFVRDGRLHGKVAAPWGIGAQYE
jgi:hypothetical protein